MGMRWDPLLARAVAGELDGRLRRVRVRALLLDPDARRVLLFLREHTLVLELHPREGWISLLPARDPLPGARPLPARVRGVAAPLDERALVLGLARIRGKDEGLELAAEMVANRWNAVVLGHRSRVVRHVLVPRKDRTRTLAPGAPYELPPPTGRSGAEAPLDEARWEALLAGARDEPEARRKTLLRNVAWTSSLNADFLLGPDGWRRWQEITDPGSWGGWVLRTPRGPQPYPVPLEGMEAEPHPSLLEAFRAAREAEAAAPSPEGLLVPSALLERAEDRARRARRRARSLGGEMERAGDPVPVRALGDLILSRFSEVPRGADRVVLTDFEGGKVEVELDPSLPPDGNANRYYQEAARLERAREILPGRIREAEEEARTWTGLVEEVREGRVPPEDLAERLGPDPREPARPGVRGGPPLPYRRFTSSGGLEIRVGRGARANDDLTFHHSAPDDVWLHARQAPGAHVILRWSRDDNPPKRDLGEAAVLAALHSEARHAGSVPVDWTRRKYVRKPRKAAPGAVLPDRVETLFVEPDPVLAERLAREG